MTTLVEVRHLVAGYGEKTVLDSISLDIPERGIVALMGPAGAGKSTILRTLSRWNDASQSFWYEGQASFSGRDLFRDVPAHEVHRRLALLKQKARFYSATVLENALPALEGPGPSLRKDRLAYAHLTLDPWGLWEEFEPLLECLAVTLSLGQQRRLTLARLVAEGARCLMVDEPFRDLSDEEGVKMAALLRLFGESMAVVLCSHNQRVVRGLAEQVLLLSGGRIVEQSETEPFFAEPRSELARRFVEQGNCWPVPTEGPAERVDEAVDVASAGTARPRGPARKKVRARRPSAFHWVLPSALGGCQQPGLLLDRDEELAGLVRLGCEVLVSLRQESPDREALAAHGIQSFHSPIPDMGTPSVLQAQDLCRRIRDWLSEGRPTVIHCKAGMGRTGTILACYLVSMGATASEAVTQVRTVNPGYIQSEAQLAFVAEFERAVGGQRSA